MRLHVGEPSLSATICPLACGDCFGARPARIHRNDVAASQHEISRGSAARRWPLCGHRRAQVTCEQIRSIEVRESSIGRVCIMTCGSVAASVTEPGRIATIAARSADADTAPAGRRPAPSAAAALRPARAVRDDDQNRVPLGLQFQQQFGDRAWAVVRSRLPVGSSASSSVGSRTSARAMATRCRSPPESSAGRWVEPLGQPDAAEQFGRPLAGRRAWRRHRPETARARFPAPCTAAAGDALETRSRSAGGETRRGRPRRVRTDPGRRVARCRTSAARACRESKAACSCRSRWGRESPGSRRAASGNDTPSSTRSGSAGVGYSLTMFSTTRSAASRCRRPCRHRCQVTGHVREALSATASGIGIDTGGSPCGTAAADAGHFAGRHVAAVCEK